MSIQPGWRERLIAQLHRERDETVRRNEATLAQIDQSIEHHQAQLAEENETKNP